MQSGGSFAPPPPNPEPDDLARTVDLDAAVAAGGSVAGSAPGPGHQGTPMPPSQLGPFRLRKRLGKGGQASVYLADQPSLGRQAAVKVLAVQLAADPSFVERFHREAHVAARLRHPNVVTVYDSGVEQGYHWLAMELVAGQPVDELVRASGGRIPFPRALRITRDVAAALAAAAKLDIIHRDVKPANVLLDEDGTAKLADLGLAKQRDVDKSLTATGIVVGTPRYMSPEMILGEGEVDIRADIYSLGVMLYELATGTVPLRGASLAETLLRHTQEEVPPPSKVAPELPAALDRVVARMTAIEPTERYASPDELAADLDALARGERPRHASASGRSGGARRSSGRVAAARRSSGRRRVSSRSSQRELGVDEAPTSARGASSSTSALVVIAVVAAAMLIGWLAGRSNEGDAGVRDEGDIPVAVTPAGPSTRDEVERAFGSGDAPGAFAALRAALAARAGDPEERRDLLSLRGELLERHRSAVRADAAERGLAWAVAQLVTVAADLDDDQGEQHRALAVELCRERLAAVDAGRLAAELPPAIRERRIDDAEARIAEAASALDEVTGAVGDRAAIRRELALDDARGVIAFWQRSARVARVANATARDRPDPPGVAASAAPAADGWLRVPRDGGVFDVPFARCAPDELAARLGLSALDAGVLIAVHGDPAAARAVLTVAPGDEGVAWREAIDRIEAVTQSSPVAVAMAEPAPGPGGGADPDPPGVADPIEPGPAAAAVDADVVTAARTIEAARERHDAREIVERMHWLRGHTGDDAAVVRMLATLEDRERRQILFGRVAMAARAGDHEALDARLAELEAAGGRIGDEERERFRRCAKLIDAGIAGDAVALRDRPDPRGREPLGGYLDGLTGGWWSAVWELAWLRTYLRQWMIPFRNDSHGNPGDDFWTGHGPVRDRLQQPPMQWLKGVPNELRRLPTEAQDAFVERLAGTIEATFARIDRLFDEFEHDVDPGSGRLRRRASIGFDMTRSVDVEGTLREPRLAFEIDPAAGLRLAGDPTPAQLDEFSQGAVVAVVIHRIDQWPEIEIELSDRSKLGIAIEIADHRTPKAHAWGSQDRRGFQLGATDKDRARFTAWLAEGAKAWKHGKARPTGKPLTLKISISGSQGEPYELQLSTGSGRAEPVVFRSDAELSLRLVLAPGTVLRRFKAGLRYYDENGNSQ